MDFPEEKNITHWYYLCFLQTEKVYVFGNISHQNPIIFQRIWAGDIGSQRISIHDIDLVKLEYCSFSTNKYINSWRDGFSWRKNITHWYYLCFLQTEKSICIWQHFSSKSNYLPKNLGWWYREPAYHHSWYWPGETGILRLQYQNG